jgi:hypothetical protein
MRFVDAAEVVLRTANKPLTVHEIVEIALDKGLLKTHGKTPEATMSAALYALPAEATIRRDFQPGSLRAVRGSVRWVYVGKDA